MTLRLSHRIGLMAPIAVAGILSIVGIFAVEQRIADDYRATVEETAAALDKMEAAPRAGHRPVARTHGNAALAQEWTAF